MFEFLKIVFQFEVTELYRMLSNELKEKQSWLESSNKLPLMLTNTGYIVEYRKWNLYARSVPNEYMLTEFRSRETFYRD